VNTRALSLNVVIPDQPTMLRGLGQKALERVQGFPRTLSYEDRRCAGCWPFSVASC
jgi:hypothetical protein